MPIGIYRPWGLLPWIMSKCPDVDWGLLGTLSTEERCLATWQVINASGRLTNTYLADIIDPPSPRYSLKTAAKRSANRSDFLSSGGTESVIHEHALFEKYGDTISWVEDYINSAGPNLIIDISTFPKRFFFPIVKLALRNSSIRNLITTYATPQQYPLDEPLAENFEDWRPLPLFSGNLTDISNEMLIVNVGYLAMGLPEELEHGGSNRLIKLIFPFPDSPGSYHKNSYFVRTIEKNIRPERLELRYVNTNDVSDAFDHLLALTESGRHDALFAPYGPKPISLAMCIFATLTNSAVYYTQPKTYNPDYSIGIAYVDNVPEIYAYCLRLEGHDYYSI